MRDAARRIQAREKRRDAGRDQRVVGIAIDASLADFFTDGVEPGASA